MDESRKQFEEWYTAQFTVSARTFERNELGYISPATAIAFKAWQASRARLPIVAYLTHHGDAVTPGDFEGGEAEMHETAKREEWAPLVKKGA